MAFKMYETVVKSFFISFLYQQLKDHQFWTEWTTAAKVIVETLVCLIL